MATAVEEDFEYESDPEDAKRSLTMRRRVASDDEEGEGEGRDKREDRRVGVRSDDSDGEGGVADYDEDDDDDDDDANGDVEEELEEVEVEAEEVYEEKGGSGVEGSVVVVKESDGDVIPPLEDSAEVHSEEKKENEPFAVPTAGAFYMHDDRFRDNAGARNRRIRGGRRLWESKDDRKWGHDKFEEITFHERNYEEGRRPSKGNYRGRAKNRGTERGGYVQGNRKGYNNSSNQNQVSKGVVRGRGPRRYEPTDKSNGLAPQVQNKQSGKFREKISHISLDRTSKPTSNEESGAVPARKQVFASNLNYASPPFYPSGSSNKENNLTQKKDVQTGSTSRNIRPVVMDEGFAVQQNNALLRGKNVVDSISLDKLYIDESISPTFGKPLNHVQMAPSGINASQSPHVRTAGTGRGVAIPVQMNYQPAPSHNQKVSPTQLQAIQRNSAAGRTSTSVQATTPQLGHRPGSGSQSSSPPKTSGSINSFDSGEMDAASESAKAKGALIGKGKGGSQGSGRGSFVYGGAQVMGAAGNVGVSQGDPNFPATPAFLPVMQFGGQHPGGMGVPAVGMAFPGYVAQPNGLGSSEMTWLPLLAGAAGALGASYCSPYLAVDGAYTRQSGQTSVMGTSSKEHNVNNKANNELKPPQRSELVSDEFEQRQNKPRRYSEMNFGQ
ncbi:protein MLN51 homolog isoform X2 [Gastrolobium bilobum]|uniref:protein MLN51 homolog isoform X2 n=1 Tax=Gastrolobium bilobum TaxID=150636 RepID=UPI002AB02E2B|nr:protein MLN51 homolog isoform X2 [Gastrolobium bilobum]